mgnify:CR=1 FL=1
MADERQAGRRSRGQGLAARIAQVGDDVAQQALDDLGVDVFLVEADLTPGPGLAHGLAQGRQCVLDKVRHPPAQQFPPQALPQACRIFRTSSSRSHGLVR